MAQRAEVVLSDEERETLERWARRPKSSQALAFRCRVVLAAAEGRSSTEIAAELGCTGSTVGKILDNLASYCQRINDSGH
jgi:DNA-binding CsgD family transcriptional regulator